MHINDFLLERFFGKYEFSVEYLLCASDCESFSIQEILSLEQRAGDAFLHLNLGYTESQGNPDLRREIASLYHSLIPDDILVCAGAEEGIFIAMNILLNPGDHCVVQTPAYQSLHEIARAIGCDVTGWQMEDNDGWHISVDSLKDAIQENTKLIIINSPHNPTGYQFTRTEFEQIRDIAATHDIWIFSDEVYRELEYNPAMRLDGMTDKYKKGISLGVMSKAYGLPGLRLGWLACADTSFLEQARAFKDYTTICTSAPSEYLATIALRHRDILLKRNITIITENIRLFSAFCDKHQGLFDWKPPLAGSISFPRLDVIEGSKRFCDDLMEKYGVLLMPGTLFSYDDMHVRVGFGRKNFPEGLARLNAYIKTRS